MTVEQRCGTCKFFKSWGDLGDCRRFPPNQPREGSATTRWTTVRAYDWMRSVKAAKVA